MVYTRHFCAKCGSDQIRRNGHSQGHARYQCKACRYQARFEPAAVAKVKQYAQVDMLLEEHTSQRIIVRLTGISRMTIAGRIKKSSSPSAGLAASAAQKGAEKAVGSPGIG